MAGYIGNYAHSHAKVYPDCRMTQSGSNSDRAVSRQTVQLVHRADRGEITAQTDKQLLQLHVLRLGLLQDGDVGVGVFPEGEEILIGSFRFGRIALEHIRRERD